MRRLAAVCLGLALVAVIGVGIVRSSLPVGIASPAEVMASYFGSSEPRVTTPAHPTSCAPAYQPVCQTMWDGTVGLMYARLASQLIWFVTH